LAEISNPDSKKDIDFEYSSHLSYNEHIFERENLFKKYYDNCGNERYHIYPRIRVWIGRDYSKAIKGDKFTFLRTDDGYKLISVIITSDETFMLPKSAK
jgi:hypothetical protein